MLFEKGHIPWIKGRTHSKKTRELISAANKGRTLSEEAKHKISEARKGKPTILDYTKEIREKMSESHKGLKRSEKTKLKMSNSKKGKFNNFYGKSHTKENKEKMSEAAKLRYGEISNHWKGGITPVYKSIRNSFKYRQWRSDVFYRDDFTCQECGQRGGRLHAHHINPFASIIQYYEITTIEEAFECDELWNINNGITLCKGCHKILY